MPLCGISSNHWVAVDCIVGVENAEDREESSHQFHNTSHFADLLRSFVWGKYPGGQLHLDPKFDHDGHLDESN